MLKNPERSQQQGLKRVASASVQFAPQEWEVLRAVVFALRVLFLFPSNCSILPLCPSKHTPPPLPLFFSEFYDGGTDLPGMGVVMPSK